MTRLSDSLRALAERAPVEDASISVTGAATRVRRGRRMRAAANATAGLGAASVIAFAAMPHGDSAADSAPASDLEAAAIAAPEEVMGDASGGSKLAFGACGTTAALEQTSDTWALTIDSLPDAEPGATATVTLTGERADGDSVLSLLQPTVVVLWNGTVVATGEGTLPDQGLDASAPATWSSEFSLVNCWDSSALPAGEYQVVAMQEYGVLASEPTAEASSDPSAAPSVTSTDIGEPTYQSAVSNIVSLTITGDPVDDPFGVYLGTAHPDNYLDPTTARAEYLAHLTTEAWDMAPGSQRVIRLTDSTQTLPDGSWMPQYFTCAADGAGPSAFPSESAQWPLLDVSGSLPSAVSVSYGWVVDGNPRLNLDVRNASDYSLPGFYGQPNSALILVKDGEVIAEAYPTQLDPNAAVDYSTGLLEPGATVSGDYLWRDLPGCWTQGRQERVEPGTYTVLNVQYLYLDNGSLGGGVVFPLDDASATVGDGSTEGRAPAEVTTQVAVGEPNGASGASSYDYIELQVWTSLGTVTVTQ